jgi:hypothetical protein
LPGWRADFATASTCVPLFAELAPLTSACANHTDWPEHAWLNRLAGELGIRNATGQPLRFIAQAEKCSQRGYELGIHASAEVPTRPRNWHDLFNALIWLAYPLTKAALNARQATLLSAADGGQRGAASDAATLFDESGLVLVTPNAELAGLLAEKCWVEAFWTQRHAWARARLHVIGHSLLEKALTPTPGITGKCLFIEAPADLPRAEIDRRVAAIWTAGSITRPAQLFPLPVAGVPGFDPGNSARAFYDNVEVFRPPRR